MTCWGPTDEHSLGMAEGDCSHEQNEDQGYDRGRGGSDHEQKTSDEGEVQDSLAYACHGVRDPSLGHHVGFPDRQPPPDKVEGTSGGERDRGEADAGRDDLSMRTFWECDHVGQGKSTLMGVGSAGMWGSGDHGYGEDAHCDHPRGVVGQVDVTRCSNAC